MGVECLAQNANPTFDSLRLQQLFLLFSPGSHICKVGDDGSTCEVLVKVNELIHIGA